MAFDARGSEKRMQEARFDARAKYIDFRGKIPLSCAVLVGSMLPSVAGFSLRTQQITGGNTTLWSSKVNPSEAAFEIRHEEGGEGEDALVFLSVSGNALGDAKQLFRSGLVAFTKLVYAEPSAG